jgi:hypothetical protein
MGYSAAAKNLMLNALGAVAVFASLHTDDPADNGANEVAGGSPAYARKGVTWNGAAAGAMDDSTTPAPVFDVPAGTTVKYVGFWSAVFGGTFYGSAAVTNEAFAAQGTYTMTDADLDLNAA